MNEYIGALSRLYSHLKINSDYFITDKCDDDYDLLYELIGKYEKLSKALDKACERLEFNDDCCDYEHFQRTDYQCHNDIGCTRCWKEWLLREVQEDE